MVARVIQRAGMPERNRARRASPVGAGCLPAEAAASRLHATRGNAYSGNCRFLLPRGLA